MALLISEAFRRYGATLRNVNWSVSSWADDETLVVSLWAHHVIEKYAPGVLAFGDNFDRWSGLGNKEFRVNILRAFQTGAAVRLVLARTEHKDQVQAGDDGSKIPKTFAVRDDVIGHVSKVDGAEYVIEFRKNAV